MSGRAKDMQSESTTEWFRGQLAALLQVPPLQIDLSTRFRDLGLSSKPLLELLAALAQRTGTTLRSTVAWEHPTPEALLQYVWQLSDTEPETTAHAADACRPCASADSLAIVGIGCRFPGGVHSPEDYWSLLSEGRSGVREVTADRIALDAWFDADPAEPGKLSTRFAGALDEVDRFDAKFFGISSREARQMDPQQRLVLELAWEALEDARIDPSGLRELPIGVFIGAMWSDYARVIHDDLRVLDLHSATGQDTSIISARVSYLLGVSGASLTVNTACSSSLVAIYLAGQSLRSGENIMALAGGVNVHTSPESTVLMTKSGAMNPAGQCRAFDAGANGYVRGEGGGVLVLKLLSRAIADGDHIYASIIGAGINNDGFSNGLTAPNPKAQEAVIKRALAAANLAPEAIAYVETHGPGTILGDPIEASALAAALTQGRASDKPLRIGSTKTNLGHLEAAAGIAGVIKLALSLEQRMLPPNLHFERPNPHIPFEALKLRVQTKLESWPATLECPRGGVSSFGFGGTNCHLLLAAAPSSSAVLLPLAADNRKALKRLALGALELVSAARSWSEIVALCAGMAERCTQGRYRVALLAEFPEQLIAQLTAVMSGEHSESEAAGPPPRVAFVCPGQGAQWLGMGRSLLVAEPVFRDVIEACDRLTFARYGWSIIDELVADETHSHLHATNVTQVVITATQIALGELWRSWGLTPDAIIGSSVGEVAACYLAGVLTLEDAMRVTGERGALMHEHAQVRTDTGMLALTLPETLRIEDVLEHVGTLEIGVYNSWRSIVLAGTHAEFDRAEPKLTAAGVSVGRVRATYGSHFQGMDPLLPTIIERLREVRARTATTPMFSAVTGTWLAAGEGGAQYWADNLRRPVLFRHGIEAILERGVTTFVELSSHPLLVKAVEQTISARGASGRALASCCRGDDERRSMLQGLGELYRAGFEPNWAAVFRPSTQSIALRPELLAELQAFTEAAESVGVATATSSAPTPLPFALSGKDAAALAAQASTLAAYVEARPELSLADVAYSLVKTRAAFESRAVVVARDHAELIERLRVVAQTEPAAFVAPARAAHAGKLVFVFPGQGGQWLNMARELLETSEVFAREIAACEEALAPFLDWSLTEVLRSQDEAPLEALDMVQPLLFSVMVSLAALWRSKGVEPDAVIGHSQGEIAAAYVAGVLTRSDAARIVALRSRALKRLTGLGGMAAVELPAEAVQQRLDGFEGSLAIAAVNGPHGSIVSGDLATLDRFVQQLTAAGILARRVRASGPGHCPQIEPLRDEMLQAIAPIQPRAAALPFYSTVDLEVLAGPELDAEYWYRNARQTVRFAEAVQLMLQQGCAHFVEVSAHPTLTQAILTNAASIGAPASAVGTLRRDQGGLERFMLSLGELYVGGAAIDLANALPVGHKVSLPTYAFQRERYWIESESRVRDVASVGVLTEEHPLLGARVKLADGQGSVLTGRLSLTTHAWLSGHRVYDTVLLPGTAFVELALAAGQRVGLECVDELTLETPLIIPEQGGVVIQLMVGRLDDEGGRSLVIYSRPEAAGEDADWTCHARGALVAAVPSGLALHDSELEVWPPAGAAPVSLETAYPQLLAAGGRYGEVFRGLVSLYRRGDESFAEVRLPVSGHADCSRYALHPALLDAALHPLLLRPHGVEVALPFSWQGVSLQASGATAVRVRIRPATGADVELTLADEMGSVIAHVEALRMRPASAAQIHASRASHEAMYRLDWVSVAQPVEASSGWVSLGQRAAVLPGARASFPDLAALQAALSAGAAAPELVVHACEPGVAGADADVAAAAHSVTHALLPVLQTWLADERFAASRLVVLTHGAVAVNASDKLDSLAESPVWGLVRAAQSERPDGGLQLLDVDPADPSNAAALHALTLREPQLALRDGALFAPRLARDAVGSAALALPTASDSWSLCVERYGDFEGLALVAQTPRELAANDVRVGVHAAGLNFHDVLSTLGVLPDDRGPLGLEGAGVVLEVGSGVLDMSPGERVMGLLESAFSPTAIADRRLLVRMPAGLSFVQAAGVPATFLTAYYGLVEVARVRPGERVLVHAAAGGVGQAAVQLARHLGAEVFATASPSKWQTLRELGLDDDHIASSRTLEFEARFRTTSGGAGMDVVLDCLAHEFVDASLRLTRPEGRFVELGKSDVRDSERVAVEYSGVRYRAFELLRLDPEDIQQMLRSLVALFERRVLHTPALSSWDVRRAPEAFKHMAQARHVGKIVLTLPRPLERAGTVLITGGAGMLGALVARHLVKHHAVRHLLLCSRSGRADALQTELTALGAEVTVAKCDVSVREELRALLGNIPAAHPLTAVFHTAGVLDDGVLSAQSAQRIDRVFAPKLDGAWHLHELTRDQDLTAFVLFSSAMGLLGGPGQSNYAAANTFLDALAQQRRAQGLPATSLAWGYWAQHGAGNEHMSQADESRIRRSGLRGFGPEEGMLLFDAALASADALIVPAAFDTTLFEAASEPLPPLLQGLARARRRLRRVANAASNGAAKGFAERLTQLPKAERERSLMETVAGLVGPVLGTTVTELDAERPLREYGLDSLMSVELRNRLARVTGLKLPSTLLFDYPTAAKLVGYLDGALVPDSAATDVAGLQQRIEQLNALLSSMNPDAGRLAVLGEQLRAIARKCDRTRTRSDMDPELAQSLDQASDQELRDILDQTLSQ